MFHIIRLQRAQRVQMEHNTLRRAEMNVIKRNSFRGDNGEKIHLLFNNGSGKSIIPSDTNSMGSVGCCGSGGSDEQFNNEHASLLSKSNGVIIVPSEHDSRLKLKHNGSIQHKCNSPIRT